MTSKTSQNIWWKKNYAVPIERLMSSDPENLVNDEACKRTFSKKDKNTATHHYINSFMGPAYS